MNIQPELLQIKNLKTCFFTEDGEIRAVDGVDLTLRRGETLGIVGESGCGKSVMALSILRLIAKPGKIAEGSEIIFNGTDLCRLAEAEMYDFRGKRIAMIFQQPTTSLNPVFKVGDQVKEALEIHTSLRGEAAKKRCKELFDQVGLPDPVQLMQRYPHQLSGGQCQRVMIAMALACEPELLIADEPTTALDVTIQAQILDLLRNLQRKDDAKPDLTIMLITHDMGVVAEMAHNVAVMYLGQIVEYASVSELFAQPKHPYTQGLLESMPKLGEEREELAVIKGEIPKPGHLPSGCRFADRCLKKFEQCDQAVPMLILEREHQVRCWLYEK